MDAATNIQAILANIERVIKGKGTVIELAVTALLARGHLLIEDVPGVGKTTLAHSLARSLDCSFKRIQFTSDLLPSDIVGVSVFHQQKQTFEFKPATSILVTSTATAISTSSSSRILRISGRETPPPRAPFL